MIATASSELRYGRGTMLPDANESTGTESQGHPKGLYVLFFTEMWERFCYYGMRALLVLYMVNYFKWTQDRASNVYKWYTSLVYLTPLLGGYLADRYLGNKRAVIIGALLMAAGEFMMAFQDSHIFFIALALLIIGNGFFKPNMSTQVGRLYPKNDPRRDGAYTIFYMGINIGAGASPLVCGWLHDNYGFGWGFAAAGVGMLLGLATYLLGLPLIKEISGGAEEKHAESQARSDEGIFAFPTFSKIAPKLCYGGAAVLGVMGIGLLAAGRSSPDNAFIIEAAAAILVACGWILSQVGGAARERVVSIYAMCLFVIFFWFAFEQAGNAMNLWADQVTDRFVTAVAPAPSIVPPVAAAVGFGDVAAGIAPASTWEFGAPVYAMFGAIAAGLIMLLMFALRRGKTAMSLWFTAITALVGGLLGTWVLGNPQSWRAYWNPLSTESFQSVNSIAIVAFAPAFAWLWTWLGRRGRDLSIPAKMSLGIAFMSAGFAIMLVPAKMENKPTETPLAALPALLPAHGDNHALQYRDPPDFDGKKVADPDKRGALVDAQAGRLFYDKGTLSMRGVLPDVERDRMLRATVPAAFVKQAQELALATQQQKGKEFTVEVALDPVPAGFDLRQAGFNPRNLEFDAGNHKLIAHNIKLEDKDYKALLLAGAEPTFREAIDKLYVASSRYKVSPWWLVWFYVLSTLGELCLSPVGLSMASKLAPAKFATMLMGIWLLTSFFGNFAAGALGEFWGTIEPSAYFMVLVLALGVAAGLLALIAGRIVKMMHGVK